MPNSKDVLVAYNLYTFFSLVELQIEHTLACNSFWQDGIFSNYSAASSLKFEESGRSMRSFEAV